MNDKRFIELLNLYVDQELTDDEARALEQEIANKPERRQVYTQYCRMQRACVRLFDQQKAPAPAMAALRTAAEGGTAVEALPVRVLDFPDVPVQRRNRPTLGWALWSGGLMAAAACVTFLVVRQSVVPGASPATSTPAYAAAAPATTSPAVPSTGVEAASSSAYRPVMVVNALLRPGAESGASATAASLQPTSLEWLQEMKLAPMRRVPFETLRFDPQGGIHAVEQSSFALDESQQPAPTEISAFQFQR